jgi:hypothetical protein
MDIIIDHKLGDDVIRLLEADSTISIRPRAISLGAALEFSFWAKHRTGVSHPILEQWRKEHPLLQLCWDALLLGRVRQISAFESVDSECFRISANTSFVDLGWGQFLSRFTSAMRRHGMQMSLAHGVSGALHEIADNVLQHSCFANPSHEMAGLVAYFVTTRKLAFVVGDAGTGALASLKTNPAWAALTSDREALHAIARKHASRRVGQGGGQGYREVFTSLASYNGVVRLRSNCGIFQLTGALDRSTPIGALGPLIPGFHLTVECDF